MIQILIAQRIRQLREEYDISKAEIARLLNYGKSSICQWESGHCRPNYETLAELAQIFHTTTDYLIGLTNERNRE